MELPSYSRQLLQQLHTLRKEGQFCDCTILVGDDPHRAHKLVLAASSLLFKSVLEGSDSISIDPAVVTSQEFSNLLEMVYTGKLPPGKHNLTRVITAADSLQMFDVAVSCKNILTSLMKPSPVQSPTKDQQSSGSNGQAASADAAMPSSNKEPSQANCTGALEETEMAASGNQEVNSSSSEDTAITDQLADQSAMQDLHSGLAAPSCKKACLESPDNKGTEERDLAFLCRNMDRVSEVVWDVQPWLKAVETWEAISNAERRVILDCCKEDAEGSGVLRRLLNTVTEGQGLSSHTVLAFLGLFTEANPDLATLLQKGTELEEGDSMECEEGDSIEAEADQAVGEKPRSCVLLDHAADLIDSLSEISSVSESLNTAAESCLEEQERKVVEECCRDPDPREAAEHLVSRVKEGALSEEGLLKVLQALTQNSPSLEQLLARVYAHQDPSDKHLGENQDEEYAVSLLTKYRCRLSESPVHLEALQRGLEAMTGIAAEEKECIQAQLNEDGGAQGVDGMLCVALEGGSGLALTVWRLLFRAAAWAPTLGSLLQEVREEPGAQKLLHSVMDPESLFLDILLKHRALILETVGDVSFLEDVVKEAESQPQEVTEFIGSCGTGNESASVKEVLARVLEEQSLPAQPFCTLLTLSSVPQLLPLKEDLEQAAKEVELRAEPLAAGGAQDRRGRGRRKEFFCQWCGKAFAFMCRMEVHRRRCCLSKEARHRCPQCPEELPTPRALKQHLSQAHQAPVPKKRKKQEQVACDICGKTFAHPSGMMYHKRTEHFDEKPYVCKECGAKFAANSSLKNHMRLHTGERPFLCKHCDMSFSQAAALSYHTKKKHSEGKMYACQYCEALFAQSIELTRHVRTHTGDKPYVCRECGKGFSQANGLSVHLQTFHNIMNPHDCQKCRMSFPSLEDHRQHIQQCHPKEFHQCDVCSKIFATATLLMKHMVTHIGKKPFSCKICHKAYQQLSGLWYHNRTTHPEVFAAQGPRHLKSVFQCSNCNKAFCTNASLLKHQKAEHPEKLYECENCSQAFTQLDALEAHKKEDHPDSQEFRCLYCPSSYQSAVELQEHLCSQHFSQEGEAFGCTHCSLIFPTQLEVQEHFLSQHQEVLGEDPQASTSQMVIQTEEPASGTDQVLALGGSQVYVALTDSESDPTRSEIVAVNMDDLLDGSITFICEEGQ
ncbi:zinc finger and BTB domain-containing protein 40 [Conger conger]|uniref:zinc finger and BTB domain-containing protein 40 n=1 Tax=Conger conger TaxID=82655 RepID=UPI002A59A7C4|nr:zinc finger and BTB domain-containing protein 40 [Conger conger]